MVANWASVTLGEITDWASGGTPSKGNQAYWGGNIPWISASSMKTPFLCDSDLKITVEGLGNGSRLAPVDSVLLLVRGSELHKRIPVGIATLPVAFNQDVKALRARKHILPRYLFYWLIGNEPMLLGKVEHTGIGAGKLDTNVLKELAVNLPPLAEQKTIADILGTLDDKIELNRRTNETLEAMATAIFRSWFVDFDPVHAKSKGRQPDGMDAETARLFPSSFVDSEIGKVPKGWSVQSLDAIATFLNGLACQKYPPTGNDSLPVIKIADLRNGVSDTSDRANPAVGADYIVKNGDVLFSWSGSLLVKIWTGGKGVLNQHLFKVTSDRFPRWFYYFWVVEHLLTFQSIAQDKATTMGHIKRNHLTDAKVVVPDLQLLQKADLIIAPLVERWLQLSEESAILSATRDALLPRLMSGEVTVENARQHGGCEANAK